MSVIIDGRLILPQMTGIGRYLIGLTSALRTLPGDESFELWLQKDLPKDHQIWKHENERLILRRMSFNHMSFQQQWRIPIALKKSDYDIFHHPHFDLPFFTPGNIVVTIHDLKYIAHPEFFPQMGFSKRILIWGMMHYSVRKAFMVITVSENTKRDIIRFLHVNPEKVVVIPEGVNSKFKIKNPKTSFDSILRKYDVTLPFILFVGELRPHKNVISLIRTFQLLTQYKSKSIQLVISGKSYGNFYEPEILVATLGLSDIIRFVNIMDQDLPMMYQAADAFITLSLYEGFGLPVLEAMASGTPVVSSNLSSLPEVVGEAGILVDPCNYEEIASAVAQVMTGGGKRDAMIDAGLKRVKNFSWENCAIKTMEVYRKAISS